MSRTPSERFRDYTASILRRAIAEYRAASDLLAEANARHRELSDGMDFDHADFLEHWLDPAVWAKENAELRLVNCVVMMAQGDEPHSDPRPKPSRPYAVIVDGSLYVVSPDPDDPSADPRLVIAPAADVAMIAP